MRNKIVAFIVVLISICVFAAAAHVQVDAQNNKSGGDIVVQTIPGPTIAEKLADRTKSSWSWYVTRGSGLIAAAALTILMLSGIGQVTGHTFKFLEPLTAWASHRALGITFGLAVLVHGFSLLFDHFVPFTFWQILVPWQSGYKPLTLFGLHLGSLYVALGILAFYGTAIVVITSLLWVEKKPYLWKFIHLFSYLIILFVFVHALFLGTDLAHGILRIIWIALSVAIAWAALARLWRANTV